MSATTVTKWGCSVCGDTATAHEAGEQGDWLVASVPGSRCGAMVIRCPKHITKYAIRKAGGHFEQGQGVVNHYYYPLAGK
jgi:hypothetical protein